MRVPDQDISLNSVFIWFCQVDILREKELLFPEMVEGYEQINFINDVLLAKNELEQ